MFHLDWDHVKYQQSRPGPELGGLLSPFMIRSVLQVVRANYEGSLLSADMRIDLKKVLTCENQLRP